LLSLKFVRENKHLIEKDLKKRQDTEKKDWPASIIKLDTQSRKLKVEVDTLRASRNKLSQQVNELKKQGKDIKPVLKRVKAVPEKIAKLEVEMQTINKKIKFYLMRLPNILHESVPYGIDSGKNQLVKTYGKKPSTTGKTHNHLLESLNLVDLERAARISGSRFFFLKGVLARLDLALQSYAVDFLMNKGFTPVIPPFMMNRASYEGVTDLKDFEDVMYKVENEDLYLIATSEHPLTGMFMNEVLEANTLPIKYCGISTNFRKEAGSHGKADKGIWRVHQFNKIEQIIICKPEQSWKYHEELLKNAVELFSKLGLHFRVVNICTGDIGIVAAKKYDLEVYMPSIKEFKEVVSCSNCTSYQAVRLNLRFRTSEGNIFPHTLNSTCVATSRALAAILEQFQNKDGSITIPKVLVPYMNGIKKIK